MFRRTEFCCSSCRKTWQTHRKRRRLLSPEHPEPRGRRGLQKLHLHRHQIHLRLRCHQILHHLQSLHLRLRTLRRPCQCSASGWAASSCWRLARRTRRRAGGRRRRRMRTGARSPRLGGSSGGRMPRLEAGTRSAAGWRSSCRTPPRPAASCGRDTLRNGGYRLLVRDY